MIGIGGLLLGVLLMLVAFPFQRDYFRRRPELPDERGYAPETIAPEEGGIVPAPAS